MARNFIAELRRRNVLRAAVLYIGAVWALAQGIAQLGPSVGAPEATTRWFLIAAGFGFPLWLVLSWRYEFTSQGIKRDDEVAIADVASRRSHNRRTDLVIIAVLAVAVVLLLTDRVVQREQPVAHVAAVSVDKNSIAVLPFDSGGDQGEQAFSDGLSEGFIIALAQIRGLRVINPKSSFRFRDSNEDNRSIAAKLGVSHLLEGTVRRMGDTVRVSATLIRAADGSTLWAESFDRPYKDLFALQDQITAQVAGALKSQLLPKPPPAAGQTDRPPSGNLEAYDAYVQARVAGVTDAGKALALYGKAIQLDPNYAMALALKASTQVDLVAGGVVTGEDAEKSLREADAAIAKALQLAPNQAAPHYARGWLLMTRDFNWKGAEAELRRAVELAPNDGDALYQLGIARASQGDLKQAVELTTHALKINPLDANWERWLVAYLMPLGRLDEARKAIEKAIELEPKGFYNHHLLAIIDVLRKDPVAALKAAEAEPDPTWRDFALALVAQIMPDRAAADARLQACIQRYPQGWAFQIAQVYAVRGEPDAMFQWLDKALTARDPGMQSLLYDALLLRYRNDPRYAALAKKAGLPWPPAVAAAAPATAAPRPAAAAPH